MHSHATTGRHHCAHPTPLARLALACALSAPLALTATGALSVGVAFADAPEDTPEVTTAPETSEEKVASLPVRITRTMVVTSEEQALKIALKDLGIDEADVDEIDFEDEEKPYHWEVELSVGDIEYEYEINPYTGAILSRTWSRESTDPRVITRHVLDH